VTGILLLVVGFIYTDVYKDVGDVVKCADPLGHAIGEKRVKKLTETAYVNPPVVIPTRKKEFRSRKRRPPKKKSFERKIKELEDILLEKWLR